MIRTNCYTLRLVDNDNTEKQIKPEVQAIIFQIEHLPCLHNWRKTKNGILEHPCVEFSLAK